MPEVVVSDTGPILHLTEIEHIDCLAITDTIFVSNQVCMELGLLGIFDTVSEYLADSIQVERVAAVEIETQQILLREFRLHPADLSVAALAERLKPNVVFTDDLQLRKAIETRSHTVVGSVGILFRAYSCGIIRRSELRTAINELLSGSSLYTSRAFRNHIMNILNSVK